MSTLFRQMGYLFAMTLAGGCSNTPSVGIVVNHIGEPAPTSIEITPGTCGQMKTIQSDNKELITIRECSGPVGAIKVTVRCSNPSLPEAVISREFPNGDSHYVAFHDVCSSTKEQIERGNAAKRTEHAWRPGVKNKASVDGRNRGVSRQSQPPQPPGSVTVLKVKSRHSFFEIERLAGFDHPVNEASPGSGLASCLSNNSSAIN